MRSRVLLCVLFCSIASQAAAQDPAPQAPRKPLGPRRPPIDFAAGALFVGPTSFGSSAAELTRPDGSTLTLFETENRIKPGYGVEVHLGFGLTPRLFAEAGGSWQRADFESRITGDFEDGGDATATVSASRFAVEGAARWRLMQRGRTEIFVRGGAGWLRELTDGGVLYADGWKGSGGAGLVYWWHERVTGPRSRRIGLRLDGRIEVRSAGLALGEEQPRVTPVLFGGLALGFR